MFERFTEASIKTIMLAQEESRRLGHNFVGTEQLLLGLIGVHSGIARDVFRKHNLTLAEARMTVESIIGIGSGNVPVEIPFTPRAKKAIEASWDQARMLGDIHISVEHLLLGILSQSDSIGITALKKLRIDPIKLRDSVLEFRGQLPGDPSTDSLIICRIKLNRASEQLSSTINQIARAHAILSEATKNIKESADELVKQSEAPDKIALGTVAVISEYTHELETVLTEDTAKIQQSILEMREQLRRFDEML